MAVTKEMSIKMRFICTPCLLPNAARQARRATGARHERTLAAVACTRLFGPVPHWPVGLTLSCAACARLFDDLIRLEEQLWCECEPKEPGGLQVDDELELHGLLHRQVGGLGPYAIRPPAAANSLNSDIVGSRCMAANSAMRPRCPLVRKSASTTSTRGRPMVTVRNAPSKSSGPRTSTICSFFFSRSAATSVSLICWAIIGLAAFQRTAIGATPGTTCVRSSSRFPLRSGAVRLRPVRFSPGCA